MDLNKVQLIGRMGSDLTVKPVGEGEAAKPVASFRFAVNSPFDDNALWATIECWGGLAEVVKKLGLHKGSRLYLEGKLIPDKGTGGPRAWVNDGEEKNGMAQATFVIWADQVIVLDKKEQAANVE